MTGAPFDVVVVGGIFREWLIRDRAIVEARIGGSGFTAAVAAARAGAHVALLTYVGDEDAKAALAYLEWAGVVTDYVSIVAGSSGTFRFELDALSNGGQPAFRPSEATPSALVASPSASVFLVFGFPDFDPLADDGIRTAVSARVLLWDRQGWLSRNRDWRDAAKLPSSEKVYLANLEEALEEEVLRLDSANCRVVMPSSFHCAIIKDGQFGAAVIEQERDQVAITAIPITVLPESTLIGSGDVFAGVLAAGISQGRPMVDAATRAAQAVTITFATGTSRAPDNLRKAIDQAATGVVRWRCPLST